MVSSTLNATNSIWLIEMWINEPKLKNLWVPTTGAHLCRDDARKDMADWKANNPTDRFRIKRYRRAS